MGNLRGLPFFGQRLEIQDQGFSFFSGVMMAVNIHDYSLSGSLFESNSIYPLQAEGSRATVQAGVMYGIDLNGGLEHSSITLPPISPPSGINNIPI